MLKIKKTEYTKSFSSKKNAVFFIAEIGGNHQGDYAYAQRITQLAIESGADAVKFQFYTGDSLVSPIESSDRNAHFKRFELLDEENLNLIRMVEDSGSIPMASVWSAQMLNWANPRLSIHKVGSGDLTCYPMLKLLVQTRKPIILSTGLSSLNEVSDAVEFIDSCDSSYINDKKLALLQCTSAYPTPDQDANIEAMLTLKSEFGLPVGYSDHTLGSDAIEIAVALGAEIIEKHFTDTREGKSFRDHLIALTRDEVKSTLHQMRRIVALKGNGNKILTASESEAEHHISFRRSIYASRDLKAGEYLTDENLTVLRPFHGICASKLYSVIGKTLVRGVPAGHVLKDEDIN